MKRIVLAITLVFISILPVLAQDARPVATDVAPSENPRGVFLAKTNEFEALLSKNKAELVREAYQEIAALMQRNIMENMNKLKTANEAEKGRIQQVIDHQNALYGEAKVISSDPKKNGERLVAKLRAFSRTL
jgi:hypothetical protein